MPSELVELDYDKLRDLLIKLKNRREAKGRKVTINEVADAIWQTFGQRKVSAKQLQKIIDKFFDDWEAPSNKTYSKELARAIFEALNTQTRIEG